MRKVELSAVTYDRGDYASFANELSDTNWNLLKNNDYKHLR